MNCDSLDLKTKLHQMFILGTVGDKYFDALKKGLGGIIFFTDDIISQTQFKSLIIDIKSNSIIPPFLSIDQEGGRVERTQNIHNGKKYLSAKFACEKGMNFLKKQTSEIAKELKSYGVNLNFAPCIDTNTNPNNPIIGERAFSSDPELVAECGKIVSDIYSKNGIISCQKHYPGHGDANADSHLTLPKIDLPIEIMEKIHIKPFKSACEYGADMIMAAHLHCTCFEKDPIPTSLSKTALDYLRNELHFDGVIISDDMVMKGVNGVNGSNEFGAVEACIMGIKAGLNMFIYRNSTAETISVIESVYEKAKNDEILQKLINQSFEKIMSLKSKYKNCL